MIGIIIMTLIALLLSIILVNVDSYLNKNINIEIDFEKLLPGYNCGACGFGSCVGLAQAMLNSPENYKKCRYLKDDTLREMETYLRKQGKVK